MRIIIMVWEMDNGVNGVNGVKEEGFWTNE